MPEQTNWTSSGHSHCTRSAIKLCFIWVGLISYIYSIYCLLMISLVPVEHLCSFEISGQNVVFIHTVYYKVLFWPVFLQWIYIYMYMCVYVLAEDNCCCLLGRFSPCVTSALVRECGPELFAQLDDSPLVRISQLLLSHWMHHQTAKLSLEHYL